MKVIWLLVAMCLLGVVQTRAGLGLPQEIIVEAKGPRNCFPVVAGNRTAELWYDADDWAGVIRAIGDFQLDVERVTGRKPNLATKKTDCKLPIMIGTLGKSSLIDALVTNGKLDASDLKGNGRVLSLRP